MSDFLAGAGLFVAVLAAAAAMLWEPSPRRSVAMLIALALIPVLILGDQWHSAEITDLRHHLARLTALGIVAVAVVAALTAAFRRWPILLPLAVIGAVPFRTPIHAGSNDANLLIPLYLVIAGGVLATVWKQWRQYGAASSVDGTEAGAPRRAEDANASEHGGGGLRDRIRGQELLPKVLAAVLVLYALQSVYSEDFSRALQNTVFFYVPFALGYVLLSDQRWDRRLLGWSLGVVAAEALTFVLFGFWEYEARHLIWNSEVIKSNDFHTYFRVNSLFWDPNVFGRYLALTITALMAALLWARRPRLALWLGVLIAILWLGLITTFSQSSFVALLVGLVALAALRWSLRLTALTCLSGAILVGAFVLSAGGSLKINLSTQNRLNKDTSGRADLVSEGVALFRDRPIWGYGSGSFSAAYRKHRTGGSGRLTVSHTEPVTVAAEQGLIGLAAYLALLAAAFITLLRGMGAAMPGLRSPPSVDDAGQDVVVTAARAAIVACFLALVAHTMAYAGFLEDPLTWILLSIGGSLAAAPSLVSESADQRRGSESIAPSPAQAPA